MLGHRPQLSSTSAHTNCLASRCSQTLGLRLPLPSAPPGFTCITRGLEPTADALEAALISTPRPWARSCPTHTWREAVGSAQTSILHSRANGLSQWGHQCCNSSVCGPQMSSNRTTQSLLKILNLGFHPRPTGSESSF